MTSDETRVFVGAVVEANANSNEVGSATASNWMTNDIRTRTKLTLLGRCIDLTDGVVYRTGKNMIKDITQRCQVRQPR